MLVHRRVTPSIEFAGTHLYTWVERGTVRVKCFAQEHNTMSPARPRTRTTRSGVERTNHEATAPPSKKPFSIFSSLLTQTWLYEPHKKRANCFQMLGVQTLGKCVHVRLHQRFPAKLTNHAKWNGEKITS